MTSCTAEKHYNEWVKIDDNYYYYDENGSKIKDTIKKIDDEMYYFDNSGKMKTGWQKNKSKEDVYFLSDGKMAKGWNFINDEWYCFDNDGVMKTGWVENNGVWYYCKDDGAMLKGGWTTDGYYVDSNGIMQKGTGNGYVSSVTNAEDNSFDIDLNEVEYGSTLYFNFMRKYSDYDENIIIEKIQPNGNVSKESFKWTGNHNIFYTSFKNCNIAGNWIERIYDEGNNLLAENSVIVKQNPNKYSGSNNSNRIPIKTRIENAKFENEQIKNWLLKIIEDSEYYTKNGIGSVYKRDILPTYEENLLQAIRLSITYANMGDDDYINDVKLAKEFTKELGLNTYYKFR